MVSCDFALTPDVARTILWSMNAHAHIGSDFPRTDGLVPVVKAGVVIAFAEDEEQAQCFADWLNAEGTHAG